MPTRTWIFRSAPEVQDNFVSHRWRWRAVSPAGQTTLAADSFGTLEACVRDAQLSGFTGAVDPADGKLSPGHYEIRVNGAELIATPRAVR